MTSLRSFVPLLVGLVLAGAVPAADIEDTAELFSADARDRAQLVLSDAEEQADVPITIRTEAKLDGNIDERIRTLIDNLQKPGLYVLITQEPRKIKVLTSPALAQKFPRQRLQDVSDAFTTAAKAQGPDQGLAQLAGVAANAIKASRLQAVPSAGGTGKSSPTVPVADASAPGPERNDVRAGDRPARQGDAPKAAGGGFDLLKWVLIGLLVLLGLRMLFGLLRPRQPMGAPGQGMTGQAGAPQQGGGGGGFMSGLAGGIGGAMLGNWLFHSMGGGSAHAASPPPSGNELDSSSNDPGAGGGGDWGDSGGGGDWGGGDGGGGGDW